MEDKEVSSPSEASPELLKEITNPKLRSILQRAQEVWARLKAAVQGDFSVAPVLESPLHYQRQMLKLA